MKISMSGLMSAHMSAHSRMKDSRGIYINCAPHQHVSTWVPQIGISGISTPGLSFPSPTNLADSATWPYSKQGGCGSLGLHCMQNCSSLHVNASGSSGRHAAQQPHCLCGFANSFKETPLQAQHALESKEPGG